MKRKQKQKTMADIEKLHLPGETKLEAEWTDENGYHRVPIIGVWESEDGGAVFSAGAEQK